MLVRIDLFGIPGAGKSTIAEALVEAGLADDHRRLLPSFEGGTTAERTPFTAWCERLIDVHGDLYTPWLRTNIPRSARLLEALDRTPPARPVLFDESPTQRSLSIALRQGARAGRTYLRLMPPPTVLLHVTTDPSTAVARSATRDKAPIPLHRGLSEAEIVAQTRKVARFVRRSARSLSRRGSCVVTLDTSGSLPEALTVAQREVVAALDAAFVPTR